MATISIQCELGTALPKFFFHLYTLFIHVKLKYIMKSAGFYPGHGIKTNQEIIVRKEGKIGFRASVSVLYSTHAGH